MTLLLAFGMLTTSGQWAFAAVVVKVDGYGPVIQGDLAQARDEALADARGRAIEQGAGVQVEARSVLVQELLVMSESTAGSEGVIANERILQEGVDGDGLYHVRLQAEVSTHQARTELKRLLRDDVIVLVLDASEVLGPFFSQYLTQELVGMGYRNIIAEQEAPATLTDARLDELAFMHMADVVLVGHVESRNPAKLSAAMYSAHGAGSLRAYRAQKGMVLAAARADDVRGFGNTPEQAEVEACRATVISIAKEVLQSLTRKSSQMVDIIVSDLPSYAAYKRFKAILSQMRWVSDLEGVRFDSSTGVYRAKVDEGVELLAARLDQFPDFSVVRFDEQKIQLQHIGKE